MYGYANGAADASLHYPTVSSVREAFYQQHPFNELEPVSSTNLPVVGREVFR